MSQRIRHTVGYCLLAGVCVLFWGVGHMGCSEPVEEPECSYAGDCQSNQACKKGKCVDLGDIGDPCPEGRNDCRDQSADTGKDLVCDPKTKKCVEKCTTYLDCDHENGQTCDQVSGICQDTGKQDAGITDDGDKGADEGASCGGSQKCKSGLNCVSLEGQSSQGKCWGTCTKDADCKDGKACSGGHCVTYGDKCEYDAGGKLRVSCWSGLKCALEGTVEGSCLRACTESSQCPNGLSCEDKSGKKYCTKPKDQAGAGQECGKVGGKDVGCIAGYQCVEERVGATKKICTKKCAADKDCTYPRFCLSGLCVLSPNIGTAKLGDSCKVAGTPPANERCDAGLFCLVLEKDKPGLCYTNCTDSRAPQCGGGTKCIGINDKDKLCFKTCKDAKECSGKTPTCGKFDAKQTDAVCSHAKGS